MATPSSLMEAIEILSALKEMMALLFASLGFLTGVLFAQISVKGFDS